MNTAIRSVEYYATGSLRKQIHTDLDGSQSADPFASYHGQRVLAITVCRNGECQSIVSHRSFGGKFHTCRVGRRLHSDFISFLQSLSLDSDRLPWFNHCRRKFNILKINNIRHVEFFLKGRCKSVSGDRHAVVSARFLRDSDRYGPVICFHCLGCEIFLTIQRFTCKDVLWREASSLDHNVGPRD